MIEPVLVVEDYGDLRTAILAALTRAEVSCVGAASPADAIRKLRESRYSAIVIDPTVPLREDPVMLFLQEHQPAELQKIVILGEESSQYPTIRKPFNSSDLVDRVRR